MSSVGMSSVALFPVFLLVIGFVFALLALSSIGKRPLEEMPRFLWVLLIVLVPVIGPIAYFIVRHGSLNNK